MSRPDLRIVAREGITVAPQVRLVSFAIGPFGCAAMVDGKFAAVPDALEVMKAHAELCADHARMKFEALIAQRLSDNEMASTPGGLR